MLNAVALEFVLNVDELLCAALVPVKTRRLLRLMNTLKLPPTTSHYGLDLVVFIFSIWNFGLLLVSAVFWMRPEMQLMRDAKQELCGGFLGFSYVFGDAGFVVWAEESKELTPEHMTARSMSSSRYKLLRSVIDSAWSNQTTSSQLSALTGPGWSVEKLGSYNLEEWGIIMNSNCMDVDQSIYSLFPDAVDRSLASLRDAAGNRSITMCSEVAKHCNHFVSLGALTRLWCPLTCGCDSPRSPLVYPYPVPGCPRTCIEQTKYYQALHGACVQLSKEEIISQSWFKQFVDNLVSASSQLEGTARVIVSRVASLLASEGCDTVSIAQKDFRVDLCTEPNLKSLAFFCPKACRCNITQAPTCPKTC